MAKYNPYNARRRSLFNSFWFWLVLIIAIAVCAFLYLQKTNQQTATASAPATAPIENLDRPNMTDEAIQAWSYDAVLAVYSYDYLNYEQQFAEAATYFLPKTWELFHQALARSTTLTTVTDNKLSVSAKIEKDKIRILDKKIDPQTNRFTWKVQVPMQITYLNAASRNEQPTFVTLTIVRVPKPEGMGGIAISKFIVAPAPLSKS